MKKILVMTICFLTWAAGIKAEEIPAAQMCAEAFEKNHVCPSPLCASVCLDGTQTEGCLLMCTPQACEKIPATSCPAQYCQVVTDCAKQKLCVPKVPEGAAPPCGDVAYNGTEVECCKGLIKRCGFDYFDGTCNMTGKGTPYHLPICIPCGDGKCTNFENHCNCPEDCKIEYYPQD